MKGVVGTGPEGGRRAVGALLSFDVSLPGWEESPEGCGGVPVVGAAMFEGGALICAVGRGPGCVMLLKGRSGGGCAFVCGIGWVLAGRECGPSDGRLEIVLRAEGDVDPSVRGYNC